jgi:predicted RNA-binding protein YlxR (DUF448 family)
MSRGRRASRVRPAVPQRRCVGCRKARPQPELLRLVAEGGAVVPGRGKPGRGCWMCREPECARRALKTGQIPRALKGKAAAPTLDRLLEWMDTHCA